MRLLATARNNQAKALSGYEIANNEKEKMLNSAKFLRCYLLRLSAKLLCSLPISNRQARRCARREEGRQHIYRHLVAGSLGIEVGMQGRV